MVKILLLQLVRMLSPYLSLFLLALLATGAVSSQNRKF